MTYTLRLSLPIDQGTGHFLDIDLLDSPHDLLVLKGFVPEEHGDEDDDRFVINYRDELGNDAELTEWITEPEGFDPQPLTALPA